MKKFLLATVAIAALGATVPALAADLGAAPRYTKAPAYAQPIYNWTGFYIGGHLGGGFGGDNSILGSSRFLGGVQAGADYQFAPNWVAGVEAQYSWTSSNNNSLAFPGGFVASSNSDQLGSVTGRLGYTFGPTLLYAKGGYAWKDNDNLGVRTAGGAPVAFTTFGHHSDGYTVGAGAEYMFAPSWSAKLEYMYYNFGSTTFSAPVALAGARFNDDEHVVKAGVNYRFNWANPIAARY